MFNNSVILGYSFLSAYYTAFDLQDSAIAIALIIDSLSDVTINESPIEPNPQQNSSKSFPVWAIIVIVVTLILFIFVIFYFVQKYNHKKLSKQLDTLNKIDNEDSANYKQP